MTKSKWAGGADHHYSYIVLGKRRRPCRRQKAALRHIGSYHVNISLAFYFCGWLERNSRRRDHRVIITGNNNRVRHKSSTTTGGARRVREIEGAALAACGAALKRVTPLMSGNINA